MSKLSIKILRVVILQFFVPGKLLGLIAVVVIKDLMLSPSEIVVSEKIELEAKKKFFSIISEEQKALSIKKRSCNG